MTACLGTNNGYSWRYFTSGEVVIMICNVNTSSLILAYGIGSLTCLCGEWEIWMYWPFQFVHPCPWNWNSFEV